MFDTKIVIVLKDDLAMWQKLNVTAFLTSGIVGQQADLIGEAYEDASGNFYSSLIIQPIIVLKADKDKLRRTYERAMSRSIKLAIYIEEMFSTGHDAANRASVKLKASEELTLVGLAMRADKKTVDKITKGLKLHD